MRDAAHALAFVLTKRHDAAALCGLVYGFNPFCASHIAHLELLAAFGMPLALAALHLAATTRRPGWIVAFAGALIVQGLCASYYLAFFAVLLLLWVLWFVRRRDIWLLFGMAGAGAGLVAVLLPLALGFARVHRFYGTSRDIGTVRAFSADVNSLLTATHVSAFWGWMAGLSGGEGQLFPGLVAPILILIGVVVAIRGRRIPRDRWDWAVVGLGAVAAVYIVVAVCGTVIGPWRVQLGALAIGADVVFKPLSVAVGAGALALAASSRARVDPDHFWRADLSVRSRTTHVGDEDGWSLFTIAPPLPLVAPVCHAGSLTVDGATSWHRPAQRAGDSVVLDLRRVAKPCAVVMSLGPAVYAFPRRLSIATSIDALAWTTVQRQRGE